MEDLKKLYSQRAKLLTLVNNYGKNLNDSQIYYINNNTIYAESYNDTRFQGVFKVEGIDLSMLYLENNRWYRIKGKKLAEALKKSPTVEISDNGKVEVKGEQGSIKIKPLKDNSKNLYEFLSILEKYTFEGYVNKRDIEDIMMESLDTSLPVILSFMTDKDEIKNIRFVKKMIKTNYKKGNIISANACLKFISEQVYICNMQVIKSEGTKSNPINVKITHLYGIVPF